MTARQQELEVLVEDLSTLQKVQRHQPDAMQMVRDLQARIEVKKEVMEEEKNEHARRHAQLQSVVVAKTKEATKLRGHLNDIALALECGCCFEKLAAGSVSFGCGHTYCNRPNCASHFLDICPECRLPVITRVQLFGALPDVGELLEQEPEVPDLEHVQRLASEDTKASLIRKRGEEDIAIRQREREEAQRQVDWLREEIRELRSAVAQQAQKEKLHQVQGLAAENWATEVRVAKHLMDDGILSQDEFNIQKRTILQEAEVRAEPVRAAVSAIRLRMVKALREAKSLLQDGIFSQEELDNQKGLILQGRIEQAAHSVWKAEEEAAAVAAVATVAGPAVAAVTIAVCAAKAGHARGGTTPKPSATGCTVGSAVGANAEPRTGSHLPPRGAAAGAAARVADTQEGAGLDGKKSDKFSVLNVQQIVDLLIQEDMGYRVTKASQLIAGHGIQLKQGIAGHGIQLKQGGGSYIYKNAPWAVWSLLKKYPRVQQKLSPQDAELRRDKGLPALMKRGGKAQAVCEAVEAWRMLHPLQAPLDPPPVEAVLAAEAFLKEQNERHSVSAKGEAVSLSPSSLCHFGLTGL